MLDREKGKIKEINTYSTGAVESKISQLIFCHKNQME